MCTDSVRQWVKYFKDENTLSVSRIVVTNELPLLREKDGKIHELIREN
jgi:hypothetical protein